MQELLSSNGLLLVGVMAFLVMTGFKFGLIGGDTPEPELEPTAVVSEIQDPENATDDHCIYMDTIVILDGETVRVGSHDVTCSDGAVLKQHAAFGDGVDL
jgi:hypothetical protein